mmetsp:Transcript_34626/g.40076  ORF Transcript_34626/g.40076 Transcript_34626/m.40076 type:complete len:114 (+) Transcript_34626:556-897(+)
MEHHKTPSPGSPHSSSDSFEFDLQRTHASLEEFKSPWQNRLVLIVNVRLGLERVEEEYYESVRNVLRMQQCMGVMGGKKNKALYFVGTEGQELVFLDPHFVKEAGEEGVEGYM